MESSPITRRAFVAGACTLLLAGCSSSGSTDSSAATTSATSAAASTSASTSSAVATTAVGDAKYATGTHHATIEVADYGTIKLEILSSIVPIASSNFCKLVDEGFYDGLTFHRVISGFMIQGGDPTDTGKGGSGQRIKGEFSSNGVSNPISHVRGTLSMARSSANDSASSQFFIMQADGTSLDGKYAAFGHVTEGMDVVDAICAKVPTTDSNGSVAAEDQPVMTSVVMVD